MIFCISACAWRLEKWILAGKTKPFEVATRASNSTVLSIHVVGTEQILARIEVYCLPTTAARSFELKTLHATMRVSTPTTERSSLLVSSLVTRPTPPSTGIWYIFCRALNGHEILLLGGDFGTQAGGTDQFAFGYEDASLTGSVVKLYGALLALHVLFLLSIVLLERRSVEGVLCSRHLGISVDPGVGTAGSLRRLDLRTLRALRAPGQLSAGLDDAALFHSERLVGARKLKEKKTTVFAVEALRHMSF